MRGESTCPIRPLRTSHCGCGLEDVVRADWAIGGRFWYHNPPGAGAEDKAKPEWKGSAAITTPTHTTHTSRHSWIGFSSLLPGLVVMPLIRE